MKVDMKMPSDEEMLREPMTSSDCDDTMRRQLSSSPNCSSDGNASPAASL